MSHESLCWNFAIVRFSVTQNDSKNSFCAKTMKHTAFQFSDKNQTTMKAHPIRVSLCTKTPRILSATMYILPTITNIVYLLLAQLPTLGPCPPQLKYWKLHCKKVAKSLFHWEIIHSSSKGSMEFLSRILFVVKAPSPQQIWKGRTSLRWESIRKI